MLGLEFAGATVIVLEARDRAGGRILTCGAMLQPHGRVHSCGEQTAIHTRGMEGATESGDRAGREVMARLAKTA